MNHIYFVDCGEHEIVDDIIQTDWCAPSMYLTHTGRIFGLVVAPTRGQARKEMIRGLAHPQSKWEEPLRLNLSDVQYIRCIKRDVDLEAGELDWVNNPIRDDERAEQKLNAAMIERGLLNPVANSDSH